MNKDKMKRIVAPVLVAVICFGATAALVAGKDGLKDLLNPVEKSAEVYPVMEEDRDPITGETIISNPEKPNILTNVMRNNQKFTILEIVPYDYAACFKVNAPSQAQKDNIASRGDSIFSEYTYWQDLYPDYPYANNRLFARAVSDVADNEHEFYITKDENGYTTHMENYFLNAMMGRLDDTSNKYIKYRKYYEENNVEVITVCAKDLQLSDIYRDDPVDMVYIAGSIQNYVQVYRNYFIDNNTAKAGINKLKSEKSGVYYKSGDSYIEYTLSELATKKPWYNSYSMDDEGNYVPNDIKLDVMKELMNYIYGNCSNYNKNSVVTYEDGSSTYMRVPCIMTDSPEEKQSINTNMSKLMYFLCKSTDEEGTKVGDIDTYYDSGRFIDKYFSYMDESGNTYKTEQGLDTLAYVKDSVANVSGWKKSLDGNLFSFATSSGKNIVYNDIVIMPEDAVWYYCDGVRTGSQNFYGPRAYDTKFRVGATEDEWGNDTYSTTLCVHYLFGIDETDLMVPPESVYDDTDINEVTLTSQDDVYVMYNPQANEDGSYTINFSAYDENEKLYSGVLYTSLGTELATYDEKDLSVLDVFGRCHLSYTVENTEENAELIDAIKTCRLKLYFKVTNQLRAKNNNFVYKTDESVLLFAQRQTFDLD